MIFLSSTSVAVSTAVYLSNIRHWAIMAPITGSEFTVIYKTYSVYERYLREIGTLQRTHLLPQHRSKKTCSCNVARLPSPSYMSAGGGGAPYSKRMVESLFRLCPPDRFKTRSISAFLLVFYSDIYITQRCLLLIHVNDNHYTSSREHSWQRTAVSLEQAKQAGSHLT